MKDPIEIAYSLVLRLKAYKEDQIVTDAEDIRDFLALSAEFHSYEPERQRPQWLIAYYERSASLIAPRLAQEVQNLRMILPLVDAACELREADDNFGASTVRAFHKALDVFRERADHFMKVADQLRGPQLVQAKATVKLLTEENDA